MTEQVNKSDVNVENKMGTMPIPKLLFNMAIPMVVSMLIQALYNIVDSAFVGRYSSEALEAVSIAFPIQNLMIAVSTGTGVGINALLSRHLGEKKFDEANKTANTGIFLAICSYIAFAVIGLTVMYPYYSMQSDIHEVIVYGEEYLSIVTVCGFGLFGEIVAERLLQSTGKTFYSMLTQGTGAIINIILDPIFIFALNMGVRGAAWATIISQAVSCIWILKFLTGKKSLLKIKLQNMKLDPGIIGTCVSLGLAPFIMQFTESVLSVCFNTSLLKYGGDIAVGAMTILTSVMQFSMLPLQGLTQGAQPIISFNYGAGNIDRVKKAFHLLLRSSICYAAILWSICMFAPRVFIAIFTSNAELTQFTVWAMRIYMAASLIFSIQIACQQTFIALGNAKTSVFLALLRKVLLLIPLIFILPQFISNQVLAVFIAEPIADIIAVSTTAILFTREYKRLGKYESEAA